MYDTENDPIFAALDAHRKADDVKSDVGDQLDQAESMIKEPRPTRLVSWRNYTIGGSAIDTRRETLLSEPGADRRKIEKEYLQKKAEEADLIRAETQWYERHGLAALRARHYQLIEEAVAARSRLSETKPTTVAGCAALVAYVCADLKLHLSPPEEWPLAPLNTAAAALHSIAAGGVFMDLESDICDMVRAADLACQLAFEENDADELLVFSVRQCQRFAEALKEKYYAE
jgi:hypothetical protein